MQCHWHECGHVVFGNEKQYRINLVLDTPMHSGYTAFNKFIAKYMAQSFSIYNPNMYLQFALFIPQYLPRCSQRKSPDGGKMIFKASHRAGAEPFLKTKSLHIRAFLMSKFTVARFGVYAKMPENADIACILRCFVIRRPFGYMVEINR